MFLPRGSTSAAPEVAVRPRSAAWCAGVRGRVDLVRTSYWLTLLSLSCASASAGTHSDTPPTAPAAGAGASDAARDALPALVLEPGEVAELTIGADGSAGERLATPSGSERFVIVLASTRFGGEPEAVPFTVALDSGVRAGTSERVTGCATSSDAWRGKDVHTEPPPEGEGPALGATRELVLMTSESASKIQSEVVSVGRHAVVVRDTTHPTTLDAAFAEQFRVDFENVIMPRARQVFGTEPDIDGNGRVQLVFSRLTQERGVAFFSACDLLGSLAGCPGSNHGEFLYLTPPDAIAPPYNTANAIKEILTHELSHLLHFKRKVLGNGLSTWTDTVYASEGIGALAQDVVGYQAGNLYVAKAGLEGIDRFSLSDVLVRRPRPDANDGVLRGASYLFFRYLYDRAGGDDAVGADVKSRGGPAFLRALLDAPESVTEALPRVANASLADIAMDFFTTLATSNRDAAGLALPTNACFSYLPTSRDPVTAKQRGTSLFAQFHGQGMAGPRVVSVTAADGKLLPGGVEYLGIDATPGRAEAQFTLRVDPAVAPRVRVARWK
jgi:hypothetical protein